MNSKNMPPDAGDKLRHLLDRDKARMQKVTEAVASADAVLKGHAQTETELAYMRYKAGARLLLETLESFDQALLAEQLSEESDS